MTGIDNNCFDQSVFEKVFLEHDQEGLVEHEEQHLQQDDEQEEVRAEEFQQPSELNCIDTSNKQTVDVVQIVEKSPKKSDHFSPNKIVELSKMVSQAENTTHGGNLIYC